MISSDYLGYVCWYSLPSDLLVPLSDLEAFREEVDPLIKLPKKPTPINLFKRVCKTFKYVDEEESIKYDISSQDVKSQSLPTRQINKKIDSHNHILGWVSLTENNEISFTCNTLDQETWDTIVDRISFLYSQAEYVDHMAVRSVIKNALEEKLHGLWLNSGTYFVESDYLEKLGKLCSLVQELSLNCEFEIIPLVDGARRRILLWKHLDRELNAMYGQFMTQLYHLPYKASAFKVNRLEDMIVDMEKIYNKMQELQAVAFENPLHDLAAKALQEKIDTWK